MKSKIISAMIIFLVFLTIACNKTPTEPEYIPTDYSMIMDQSWKICSIPEVQDATQPTLENKGHLIWYNPYEQVPIMEIWPNREVTTHFGGSTLTSVLDMLFYPNPTFDDPAQSWEGIQMVMPTDSTNQSTCRYLNFWIHGDVGLLHVDLGQISEDVIPNIKLDTEDKLRSGSRNGLLEEDEDTGLDGIFGDDPEELFYPHEMAEIHNGIAVPYDFWDLSGDSIKQPDEPWSYDDWNHAMLSSNYQHYNGTENNASSRIIRSPDTEDLNNDGTLNLDNHYYEYTINLDKASADSQYVVNDPPAYNGWANYQIPIDTPAYIVGNPNLGNISFIRLWMNGIGLDALPEDRDFVKTRIARIGFIE